MIRTTSEHPDFIRLVQLLDADLAERDGEEHAFYHQFNSIQHLQHVILLLEDTTVVSCGAFKPFGNNSVEIKRMYTLPEKRGKGYASETLKQLEQWALEEGYSRAVLETGKRQPEAIALYEKNRYQVTENYGQYAGIENSVCFQKTLKF